MHAIRIIEREHRSLAAVLHGMLFLVREIRCGGAAPDFELLGAMVHYVDAFSEQFHHPKEDRYLFRQLALRWTPAAPLLAQLTRDHAAGANRLRELREALSRYEAEGRAAFAAFGAGVASYAAFHWDHMRLEENTVVTLAKAHLTREDWRVIDAAFAGHTDPLLGTERGADFQDLFRRIVELAPSPIGAGMGASR